jgi:hypothetical protein
MNNTVQSNELITQFLEINNRINRLEDQVFKDPSGGFGVRLKELGKELKALQGNSFHYSARLEQLDQKIDEVIRIVAELQQIIEQRGGRGHSAVELA